MKTFYSLLWLAFFTGLLATGCRGLPAKGERPAQADLAEVGGQLQTNLPVLSATATVHDAVLFAVKNHPAVAAAYADWAAAVANITVARSLPDPKLSFELFAADAVSSLMGGLTTDIPGPGKLAARGAAAAAASRAKYFQFEIVALQTALAVEKTFYPLYFLDTKIRVNRQLLALLANLATLARAQNEVGRATLQDVLRAQMEAEKLRTETENLEDSRRRLRAQFKAALGLCTEQADPPVPQVPDFTETNLDDEKWLATATKQNPRLQALAAEIQIAEAAIRVARKEKTPDFSAGFEVDAKAVPAVWNPQFSATLPIWRDKLTAEISAAQNGKRAAEARLSAAQLDLAVEFATQTYRIREANRELTLLRDRLLPRAGQTLAVARSAYRSGQADFLNVIDAERALLNFQLNEIAAQIQREIARAELTLLVVGVPPAGTPGLKSKNFPPNR